MQEISDEELADRIAVLKRFRSLLEKQKAKFQEYLTVLELQENKITEDDTTAVIAQSNLESEIVSGINSLQKVIIPMQRMYAKVASAADSEPIEKLNGELTHLRAQVIAQNERNQNLLKNRMAELRKEILTIKNPYKTGQSVYADQAKTGALVQIEA